MLNYISFARTKFLEMRPFFLLLEELFASPSSDNVRAA